MKDRAFSIFKMAAMAAVRHLGFLKYEIFNSLAP